MGRFFGAIKRKFSTWMRFAAEEPRGTSQKGSHFAFGRTFALVQLAAGRRSYLLYLPEGHSTTQRLPLVVMLHGCRQDAESFSAGTRMNALADRERFLVLYPEQRRLANVHRCWNWFFPSVQTGAGEASIVSDMIRSLATQYNVDTTRIYVAGLSAGAAMANNLATCHSELFAACALHSGLMFKAATSAREAVEAASIGSKRDPTEAGKRAFEVSRGKVSAMPVLVIHGDRDEVVNPVNADQIISQFDSMNRLLASDGEDKPESPRIKTSAHRSPGGYRYEITDYLRADRPLMRKVIVYGLGHAWSGGSGKYPFNDPRGPDASEIICKFFAEYGLREEMSRPAPKASIG